jgi:hypothetical protein
VLLLMVMHVGLLRFGNLLLLLRAALQRSWHVLVVCLLYVLCLLLRLARRDRHTRMGVCLLLSCWLHAPCAHGPGCCMSCM